MRCCAVLAGQWRYQVERVQLCQNRAIMRYDGVPLCGTHINKLPERVCIEPTFGCGSVEKIP